MNKTTGPTPSTKSPFRKKLFEIIFEAETGPGKAFDILLLLTVALSVVIISLSSVEDLNNRYGSLFKVVNWAITILFTVEYLFRLYCVEKPMQYAVSFFGVIDLLAILPGYLSIFVVIAPSLMVIKAFRLLRIFAVFKLGRFMGQANFLINALRMGFRKIVVFLGSVLTMVVIMGAIMYMIEGPENGFTNIPKSMYWAVVTLTTVGYGDIAPQTVAGQTIAAVIMLLGYGIIAVPTGILSAEIAISTGSRKAEEGQERSCPGCGKKGHTAEAVYCCLCGTELQ